MPAEPPDPAPAAPPGDDAERLAAFVDQMADLAAGHTGRRAPVAGDGSLLDGIATGLNMLADELAERRSREAEYQRRILHAARLSAVGQLAAGVAHEVNNPAAFLLANLTVMQGHARELAALPARLRAALSGGDARAALDRVLHETGAESLAREVEEMADDNVAGVQRIASIVRALLGFSQISADRTGPTRLDLVADEACTLLSREVSSRARLVKRLQPVPAVAADHAKLVQVATSLLLNAAQALPEGAPADHEVEVATVSAPGHVLLRVRDTGPGIPPEIQGRIFDPFFSSRPRGRGTGLGLSIAAEIVRAHAGEIRFRTTPGAGTTFEVLLPLDTGLAREPRAAGGAARRPRVLLVDDEPSLLSAYRRLLGEALDVTTAAGGREALALLDADPHWDAVICDLIMPDLDGQEVLEAIHARHPDLARRVAFCTAGAFTPRSAAFAASMEGRILAKPLDREELIDLVHRLASGG
jgi:signal transduction histidine kinase